MKRCLTTSLTVALAAAHAIAGYPPAAPRDPGEALSSTGRGLRVLSWNIYMLPGPVPNRQLARARCIADSVAHSEYDIVVFQEAFNQGAVRTMRERLLSAYPYMYGPFNNGGPPLRFSSGVWILSRIPLRLVGTIRYGMARSFDRVARKGAALLEGQWNGHAFQLVGTHMQADDHPTVRERQRHELLTGLLQPFKRIGVPQIICGDLNTERADEAEYRSMLDELRAEDGTIDGPQQLSYDAVSNKLANKVWEGTRTTVDYVLLRLNGAVVRTISRSIRVFKGDDRAGGDLSDHYAVACHLIF